MKGISMETIAAAVLVGGFFLTIAYVAMWKPRPGAVSDASASKPEAEQ